MWVEWLVLLLVSVFVGLFSSLLFLFSVVLSVLSWLLLSWIFLLSLRFERGFL
jgi:hypothetical protein